MLWIYHEKFCTYMQKFNTYVEILRTYAPMLVIDDLFMRIDGK